MSKYYEAYDERYKTIHKLGYTWSSDKRTPIVEDVIKRYNVSKTDKILEIGCGEGRDAGYILKSGFDLLATDISDEAIRCCKAAFPGFSDKFAKLDCLNDKHGGKYRFIYAVAVVHMLVLDGDRAGFYKFIYEHLTENGAALICTMGDGEREFKSDINEAFTLKEREHPSGTVSVAATSCRTVSFKTFDYELSAAGLKTLEEGITSSPPDFDKLMYTVVRR